MKNLYQIKLTKSINWDSLGEISALIAGSRGSGKTYLLLTLIAELASLPIDNNLVGSFKIPTQIYLIDLKNDLAQIAPLLPAGRVAKTKDEAVKLLNNFLDLMQKRLDFIANSGRHFATAKKLKMCPYYLVIDEFSGLNLAFNLNDRIEKSEKIQLFNGLKRLVLLGRSAGFGLIITSQQISVNNSGISTDLIQNVGLKIHMGNASEIAYKQTFGNEVEIPLNMFLKPSEGLIWLDDPMYGHQVRPFAAPRINSNFWEILETAFKAQEDDKYLLLINK